MPNEDTSEYWRKLLKLDEDSASQALKTPSNISPTQRFFRSAMCQFFKDRFALTSTGIENLPKGIPYLISSNHSSYLDFPAVFFCLPKEDQDKMSAVYKMLYHRILPARFFINLFVRAVPVDSDKNYMDSLAKAAKLLKSGYCMYISPEGKRSKTGELLPFKVGVGALAVETNTPVVPAYIDGAFDAMPKGRVFPHKNKITVKFGKPLYPDKIIGTNFDIPAYEKYKAFTERLRLEILVLSNA